MESKNRIHVWLIKHITTDGANYLDCAYTNAHSCRMVCSDFKIWSSDSDLTNNILSMKCGKCGLQNGLSGEAAEYWDKFENYKEIDLAS